MVHCSAVYWIMETIRCPLPPPPEAASEPVFTFNQLKCERLDQNYIQWMSTTAAGGQPLQHSPQPAALQHRLQAMWRFEEQSICLVSAHLHFCTNYALTMNTMHWLCICTLSTNTAALQTWRCPTSGEIRRLIPVSTNHQPRLSDMQPGRGLINVQTIQ